jgi:hypothetical protein
MHKSSCTMTKWVRKLKINNFSHSSRLFFSNILPPFKSYIFYQVNFWNNFSSFISFHETKTDKTQTSLNLLLEKWQEVNPFVCVFILFYVRCYILKSHVLSALKSLCDTCTAYPSEKASCFYGTFYENEKLSKRFVPALSTSPINNDQLSDATKQHMRFKQARVL